MHRANAECVRGPAGWRAGAQHSNSVGRLGTLLHWAVTWSSVVVMSNGPYKGFSCCLVANGLVGVGSSIKVGTMQWQLPQSSWKALMPQVELGGGSGSGERCVDLEAELRNPEMDQLGGGHSGGLTGPMITAHCPDSAPASSECGF